MTPAHGSRRAGRAEKEAGREAAKADPAAKEAKGAKGKGRAPSSVFSPASLGPLTLRNRIVKAATFEGLSRGGRVTDGLVDFHRTVAEGGVGLTTLAYCAVSPEGRGAPNELVPDDDTLPGLRRLVEAVHDAGAAASAQLGHAGPVANSRVTGQAALSASTGRSPLGTRHRAMSPAQVAGVPDLFARAARVLAAAGFDAVELHMGHHYLLNAFLSPRFNRREDEWGGRLENRVRLLREVAAAVRRSVGREVAVTAKFEMVDGVARGLWLDESIPAARMLEADGNLDALQLTGGGSLANPMYLFRGEVPREEFAATLPKPLRLGYRLVGHRFMPEYPFEEAYFLPYARQFRQALGMPLVLLGGVNRLSTIERAVDEGFELVAMARALLRQPDFVNRLSQGSAGESLCVHCNKCMPTIYRGTHCVLVAPEERPGLRSAS